MYISFLHNMTPQTSGVDHQSDLALPLPQADFIWRCAWLSVPSAIYAATAASTATTYLAVVPASVWATSLLYWRNPVRDSWRRMIGHRGLANLSISH
jgi:hypothetical protein